MLQFDPAYRSAGLQGTWRQILRKQATSYKAPVLFEYFSGFKEDRGIFIQQMRKVLKAEPLFQAQKLQGNLHLQNSHVDTSILSVKASLIPHMFHDFDEE